MLQKHLILIGIIISLALIFIASFLYPGGSHFNMNSVGFDIQYNFLCNLFNELAINGQKNVGRIWAIGGMFILCTTGALVFFRISKLIPSKKASHLIKYCGIGSMISAFLVITPYHDIMTTIASILALISLFYIAVFIFLSKLHMLKVLSTLSLLVLYFNNYIYYSGNLIEILPVMQKVGIVLIILWMLSLDYCAKKSDFKPK